MTGGGQRSNGARGLDRDSGVDAGVAAARGHGHRRHRRRGSGRGAAAVGGGDGGGNGGDVRGVDDNTVGDTAVGRGHEGEINEWRWA